MSETYTYYQPEYVSRFQCNGQKCQAKCCKNWLIFIDKKTYKKYSHLKPKSAAQEITHHISKRENSNDYTIKLDENNKCPFLTEDNWCSIQRKYGEKYLSEICITYPRYICNFGNFYERSLTLTCPLAAELILFSEEPLRFEKIKITEPLVDNFRISSTHFELNITPYVIDIQETAFFILQERNLTIDQRLIMLGLYCDKLDELTYNQRAVESHELLKVNSAYQNSNFLQEQADQFSVFIKFNAHEHIRLMIEILETLYGTGNIQVQKDRVILDAMINTLHLKPDETNQVKISEIATNYSKLNEQRKNFIQRFSTIFENYLVNEFFMNLYPFRFNGSKTFNFGVFISIYKILELLTFSISMEYGAESKDLLPAISWYANNIDHNMPYVNKISDCMRKHCDIVEIMQNMLQV